MGKGNPFGNMGNVPGLGNMMKQVQKMAEDTERLQAELAKEKIEAASGGGMVTAVANGMGELLDITISPDVVDPEDIDMLQDLIVSAVREAMEKATQMKNERMQELTGGLNIPGLF